MPQSSNSVQTSPAISDDMLREPIRLEMDRAINIERRFTRKELAEKSGVNIHTIDAILSRCPEKQRRIALEDAVSVAWVLGQRAVNAVLAKIGFVARPVDGADELQPMELAATALSHLSTIATAAADGRIDHTEMPACQQAADLIIATVLPLSSAGRKAV